MCLIVPRVHWDDEFVLEDGAPGACDHGSENISWLTHHITNRIGDDGFPHRSKCQVRRHNPDNDVMRKVRENGKNHDEFQQSAKTHRDEMSAFCTASTELPDQD